MDARPRTTTRTNALDGQVLGGFLLLLTQCSPERQVLYSSSDVSGPRQPAAAGGGSVGPPATGGGAGVDEAMAAGGGPALGGSTAAGGTSTAGTGGPIAGLGGGCASAVSCPDTCDHGFETDLRIRGGCAACECAPVTECKADVDCPSGTVCFAGLQCDDGCSSPGCCSGNHCAKPSCPAPTEVTCLAVGCGAGDVCLAACDSAHCTCDGARWSCTYDAGATSCASACAP
jgi:hypothetical protein